MEILSSEIIYKTSSIISDILVSFSAIIVILGLLAMIAGTFFEEDWIMIIGIIGIAVGFITLLCCIILSNCPVGMEPDYTQYKVIFEEDYPINQVFEDYELIETDGKIFIIKEREE